MSTSASVIKYSFILRMLNKETKIYLIKGDQNDYEFVINQGYENLSGGNLYNQNYYYYYYYVLYDKKWLLTKSLVIIF